MTHRYRSALALSVRLPIFLPRVALADDFTSPHGGTTTDAVVREVHVAQQQSLLQAYSFYLGAYCQSVKGRP